MMPDFTMCVNKNCKDSATCKRHGIAERFPMSTNHTLTLILREDAVITGLELNYTEEPVCPYCGHKDHDAWGINFGGMEGETVSSCGNYNENPMSSMWFF